MATLLLWSAVAVVPLVELGLLRGTTLRRAGARGLMVLMVLGGVGALLVHAMLELPLAYAYFFFPWACRLARLRQGA